MLPMPYRHLQISNPSQLACLVDGPKNGRPGGIRTRDLPLIKRMLSLLSYGSGNWYPWQGLHLQPPVSETGASCWLGYMGLEIRGHSPLDSNQHPTA